MVPVVVLVAMLASIGAVLYLVRAERRLQRAERIADEAAAAASVSADVGETERRNREVVERERDALLEIARLDRAELLRRLAAGDPLGAGGRNGDGLHDDADGRADAAGRAT